MLFGELLVFRVPPTKLFSLGEISDYSLFLLMALRGVCDTVLQLSLVVSGCFALGSLVMAIRLAA